MANNYYNVRGYGSMKEGKYFALTGIKLLIVTLGAINCITWCRI